MVTFRLLTASLHQAMGSTAYAIPFVSQRSKRRHLHLKRLLTASRDKRLNSLLLLAITISNNLFYQILTWSMGAQPGFGGYCKPLRGGIWRTSNRIHNTETQDSVTILDRSYVDCLLQHLNSQQPTIRFTIETEKDNKILFLHLSVTRERYRRLTTSVYRKPTHTNQYSAHDSHHPQ